METEVASNLSELAQLSGNVAGEGIPPQIKAVKHGAGLGIVVVAPYACGEWSQQQLHAVRAAAEDFGARLGFWVR